MRAISNALEKQRLHHAYLFTGTRGVGKTSIARILAKSLNCETGITAEPCGQCSACTQIDAGRFVDLLELDAASNTGIDNMREVIDNAQYAPTAGRFKVYLIDEVHMLSKSAFNAMLKTLEEPPAHVKFILATTDPQKVPITVLSRCLQFNLRQIPPQTVAEHLRYVLDQEQIPYEPAALLLLGHAAAGSMRDSLSLLDQAIAYGAGRVEEAGVRAMLGAIDQTYLYALLDALAARDGQALIAQADAMAKRSIAFDAALQDLSAVLQRIALAQVVPASLESAPEASRMLALAGQLSAEDVQLYYQIALHGRRDLALAPDEYAGFTMALLRMLAFAPGNAATSLPPSSTPPARRPEVPPVAAPTQATPRSNPSDPMAQVRSMLAVKGVASAGRPAMLAREAPAARAPEPVPPRPVPPAAPAPRAVQNTPPARDEVPPWLDDEPSPVASPSAAEEEVPTEQAVPAPALESPALADGALAFDGDWHSLVSVLPLGGMAKMLAQNCVVKSFSAGEFRLGLPMEHKALADRTYQDKLKQALEQHFAAAVRLHVEVSEIQLDTPAAIDQKAREARLQAAELAIHVDPFVQDLKQHFGARVVEGSIKPI